MTAHAKCTPKFLVLYLQTLYRSLMYLISKIALMNRYAFKEIGNNFMLRLLKLVTFTKFPFICANA